MTKFRTFFLTTIVFLVVLAIGSIIINLVEQRREANLRQAITEIGAVQAHSLERQLDRSLSATFALASLLHRSKEKQIDDFDALAAGMIESYGGISSLQLAPNGVVRQIYPLAGNEAAIGHDLLNDPQRRTEALAAIESRRLTLAGPFELVQGGVAIIGRLPVFIPDDTGQERFWGFTIVLIRLPELLEASNLDRLAENGYDYELWRIHPNSGQRHVFGRSVEADLQEAVPVEIEVPNGSWTLSIAPSGGWQSLSTLAPEVALLASISALVSYLTYTLFRRPEILRREVELRTRELSTANTNLVVEIAQRKRADEELKKYQHHLEDLVEERTAKLETTNEQLQREISERKRAEEQIMASLKEKEVLLKEIHHRVKNNLQVISSLLSLQSGYIEDKQALEMFKESQNRVRSMALAHEKLYQTKDLARIDFAEYIRSLAAHLFRSYNLQSPAVRLRIEVDNVSLGIDKAVPCGLIINELVSNSLKYAFPLGGCQAGEIRIGLHADNDHQLTLIIGDNGAGFPQDVDFRKAGSLGLQLVNTLTNQLGGTIELDRNGGSTFNIVFSR